MLFIELRIIKGILDIVIKKELNQVKYINHILDRVVGDLIYYKKLSYTRILKNVRVFCFYQLISLYFNRFFDIVGKYTWVMKLVYMTDLKSVG